MRELDMSDKSKFKRQNSKIVTSIVLIFSFAAENQPSLKLTLLQKLPRTQLAHTVSVRGQLTQKE